jgi:hypothetical protein
MMAETSLSAELKGVKKRMEELTIVEEEANGGGGNGGALGFRDSVFLAGLMSNLGKTTLSQCGKFHIFPVLLQD